MIARMVSKKPALMIQGTGSDVGKSLLVAGIARAFHHRGLKVRPFKPQNMSNNAAVTRDGGEIGRAQALQALACETDLTVHMNPVLLKPQTDMGSQVVVQGKIFDTVKAKGYYALKPRLLSSILESFDIISHEADLVLVEGAGSPAEVNLRAGDVANMGFAEAADLPVILAADIHRGGVIASLVGTHMLLEESERQRTKGYLINKFRGDPTLFDSGLTIINEKTGWQDFGVIPWYERAGLLPAEDAMGLDKGAIDSNLSQVDHPIHIAVPRLSRIANFDDLDPLRNERDVKITLVSPGDAFPGDADLILLPGSKSTIGDLADFRAQGWDIDLKAHIRRGGHVLGLCAGYQMMGQRLSDPQGIEGPAGAVDGLGLLDLETVLTADKALHYVEASEHSTGCSVTGYEMHVGRTDGAGLAKPMISIAGRSDGAVSGNGRIMGCYLHGLFENDAFRTAYLKRFRDNRQSDLAYSTEIMSILDGLADHMERHCDLDAMLKIAWSRCSG